MKYNGKDTMNTNNWTLKALDFPLRSHVSNTIEYYLRNNKCTIKRDFFIFYDMRIQI